MQDSPQADNTQIIILGVSIICIIAIVISYFSYFRKRVSFAFQILMYLFFNQFATVISQLLPYLSPNAVNFLCSTSLILRTGFNIAANFWICFIARTVYKESKQPGKFIHLGKYILKNIIYTYMPSLAICVPLIFLIGINNSDNSPVCWRYVDYTNIKNLLIYIAAFILTNFITLFVNGLYIIKYFQTDYKKCNRFLLLPFAQIIISLYILTTKSLMLSKPFVFNFSDVFYISEPLLYCLIYLFLLVSDLRQSKDSQAESQSLTTQDQA